MPDAEINDDRMISFGNYVVTEGKTLPSDDNIEMLVFLLINLVFMEFMRSKYGDFFRHKFNVTIVRSDNEE